MCVKNPKYLPHICSCLVPADTDTVNFLTPAARTHVAAVTTGTRTAMQMQIFEIHKIPSAASIHKFGVSVSISALSFCYLLRFRCTSFVMSFQAGKQAMGMEWGYLYRPRCGDMSTFQRILLHLLLCVELCLARTCVFSILIKKM